MVRSAAHVLHALAVELSTGNELSVRMGFQISLGDGDYGSGISRVSGS